MVTNDAYIAKYNATGGKVYCTYLGGNGNDYAMAIAVDDAGTVYVTGKTASSTFPVTSGVFQPNMSGTGDYFVSKLNPAGDTLEYST